MTAEVVEDLRVVRVEVSTGVAAALDGMEAAVAALGAQPAAIEDARDALMSAMQALSFDDLCGQRLTRAIDALTGRTETRTEADLLNGPARGGAPDQDAIDALFDD
ncbi:MAG: hypothetical protein K2X07_04165 [Caulobacteraceae bacterium]|nr:hypothetical protein [Caulobacteraceae bacterium]